MTMRYYILDANGAPAPEPDVLRWAQWFETHEEQRIVRKTLVGLGPRRRTLSTVFLGLDHCRGDGPPLLYETMIFRDDSDVGDEQRRYTTRAEALAGHAEWVRQEVAKEIAAGEAP